MNLDILAIMAIGISAAVFIMVAVRQHSLTHRLDQHIPINTDGAQAEVRDSSEFTSATVATTISLATVILAFAELAPYLGTWLLWTVITTALGIGAVRLVAPVIWRRLDSYGDYRPTLHEFLGQSFGSRWMTYGAAVCTSLGFLGALAVELTVGSDFFAALVPQIPQWVALLLIAGIGITYTTLGGFRTVIITDRIQMVAIWTAIASLITIIVVQMERSGGISEALSRLPPDVYNFAPRDGLVAFLLGIAVINIPTFLADMSVWQRIAASSRESTVEGGLSKSVTLAGLSWFLLATAACLLISVTTPPSGQNMLVTFLLRTPYLGALWAPLVFITLCGLFSATLSTASTQLIAAGHTIHTDILRGNHNPAHLSERPGELGMARLILIVVSGLSVLVVFGLKSYGFNISDLVFAVYGAQLGMVPAVLCALLMKPIRLKRMGAFGAPAVLAGFAAGWAAAAAGKVLNDANLVFLSPVVSLGVSSAILFVGYVAGSLHRKVVD